MKENCMPDVLLMNAQTFEKPESCAAEEEIRRRAWSLMRHVLATLVFEIDSAILLLQRTDCTKKALATNTSSHPGLLRLLWAHSLSQQMDIYQHIDSQTTLELQPDIPLEHILTGEPDKMVKKHQP